MPPDRHDDPDAAGIEPPLDSATARTLQARFGTHFPTIEGRPDSTIEPSRGLQETGARAALTTLQALAAEPGDARHGGPLSLQTVLGEGGMGVVHLATQRSIGRSVAVKALREEARSERNTLRLLQEAWATGGLEHPNVVPVHDIGFDADGEPVIVLKRIEGESWRTVMHAPKDVEARYGTADLLEWNLRVLAQVCNAVHFAHSRGILHRDIKPENVMVGGFGEVYVVDWGIAVRLDADGDGRLPHVTDVRDLAGTPSYMAPEMLRMDGAAPLGVHTDVYLLGATLHEVLTGEPPHAGRSVLALLMTVAAGAPPALPGVAPELAAICRRAMAADPAERYPSALALREAIEDYLRRRDALQVVREAEGRLYELLTLLDSGDAPGARARVYDLYGAARFGFRQVLHTHPDSDAARDGARRATRAMIAHELAQGDGRAARALLAEVEPTDPERGALERRVEAAEAEAAADQARIAALESLGRDLDPRIGTRTRAFVALLLGIVWTVGPLVSHLDLAGRAPPWNRMIASTALFSCIGVALVWWARDSLTRTDFNRRLLAGLAVIMGGQVLLDAAGALTGMDTLTGAALRMFLWAAIAGMQSVSLDARLLPSAFGYGAAFVAALHAPPDTFAFMAAANLLFTVNAVWIWRPEELFPPKAPAG